MEFVPMKPVCIKHAISTGHFHWLKGSIDILNSKDKLILPKIGENGKTLNAVYDELRVRQSCTFEDWRVFCIWSVLRLNNNLLNEVFLYRTEIVKPVSYLRDWLFIYIFSDLIIFC